MVKKIYHKEETLTEGSQEIFRIYGIKVKSFTDYYYAFKHMREGTEHTRAISTELRAYFLEKILHDYGTSALETALNAYMKAIIYYEQSHNNTNRKKERENHKKYSEILKQINPSITENNIENEINSYYEGDLKQVTTTIRKRNIEARNKCIEIKGAKCCVCDFDFEKAFGELGKGFIHVHHINPISDKKGEYEISPDDLEPVCPNCHAMLHRKKDTTLSIEELKEIIEEKKKT